MPPMCPVMPIMHSVIHIVCQDRDDEDGPQSHEEQEPACGRRPLARAVGLNAGLFAADVPTSQHIARNPEQGHVVEAEQRPRHGAAPPSRAGGPCPLGS